MATPVTFDWCAATDAGQLAAQLPPAAPAHGAPCAPDSFYPPVVTGAPAAALRARLDGLAAAQGFLAVARRGPDTLAVAVRPAPLESQHFEQAVFRLDAPIGWGAPPDAGLLREAAVQIVSRLRALGARLILARSPQADADAGAALSDAGFRPSGTLVTYAYRLGLLTRPLPRRRGISVRPFRESDLPHLLPLAARITATPFRRIPGIRSEQVAAFYQDWLRAAAAGKFADAVPVAERDGRPIGFLCYRTLEELRMCTGARVGGHGLAAVAAPGAIFALVAHAFEFVEDRSYFGGEFDADTELETYIAMLERIGLRRIRTIRNWYYR